MPTAIPSAAESAAKWAEVTPGRSTHYAAGVQSPRRSWKTETLAAEPRYKEGVIAAANAGRFGKGVAAVGDEKWQRKAVEVGVPRFGPGVMAASSDYEVAVAPYTAVIAGITPPQRYPTGDERNLARVSVYSKALHAKKVGG